jgi:hypothetical protein
VRKPIYDKLKSLEMAESIAAKSKLAQKDVDEFSDKIKHLAARKFTKL